jgi:hypothetical protein
MKVLMLVISSAANPVYKAHKRVWRTYMNKHPDIDCYFIEFVPNLRGPTLTQNTLYLRGQDTYPSIIDKTIKSLEYFTSRKSYDFVVRTNLSSVWVFPKLLKFLETAPRTGLYGGVINTNFIIPYISGAGITMSMDICRMLLLNKELVYSVKLIDDVDIGYTLHQRGVVTSYIPWCYVESTEDTKKEGFHYRVRVHGDRLQEEGLMMSILNNAR